MSALPLTFFSSIYMYPFPVNLRIGDLKGDLRKGASPTRQTDYNCKKRKKEATVHPEVEGVLGPRTDGRGSADHFPTCVSYSRFRLASQRACCILSGESTESFHSLARSKPAGRR